MNNVELKDYLLEVEKELETIAIRKQRMRDKRKSLIEEAKKPSTSKKLKLIKNEVTCGTR